MAIVYGWIACDATVPRPIKAVGLLPLAMSSTRYIGLYNKPKNRSLDLSEKWLKPSAGAGF